MKSEVKIVEQDDVTFPQFYACNSGAVVMFTNKTTGTVVKKASVSSGFSIGYHQSQWHPCNDEKVWTRLPTGSQVILTQENTR